ncbi:MAG: CHASE3 domain-containing protein, partial [Thermoanaerobaculia bacterium]
MRVSVGGKLRTVLGLSLIILIVIGSIAFYDTKRLVAVTAARAQARQFLWDLEQLVANLRGAENEQRGYLLTGDPSYLAAYRKSTTTFTKVFADLKVKDPSLKARVEALEPLIATVIRELDHGIEMRDKGGLQAAIKEVSGGAAIAEIRKAVTD